MSQTINIPNFNTLNVLARTNLTVDTAANVASLPVSNTQDFAAGPVLVGSPGQKTSEIVTATSIPNSNAISISPNSLLPHNYNDAITLLFGSQIRVYRANDVSGTGVQPPDANFTLLGAVNIDASNANTAYTDAAGVAGQWYKFTYYNGTSETALADSAAAQAGQVHYVGLDEIRSAAGFTNNRNVTDDLIAKKRAAAEQEINGALQAVYDLPFPQPTNPILVEIAKHLAAGMLMHELYVNVSPAMAAEGEAKANAARNGGGSFTGLQELVTQTVVLLDATFADTSDAENVHGWGGWPNDDTINTIDVETGSGRLSDNGGDDGHQFRINEVY